MKTKNLNCIYKLCWSFQKTTGLNFDDLVGVATLAYCEAQAYFDEAKGVKFNTFVHHCMRSALLDYIKKEQRMQFVPIDLSILQQSNVSLDEKTKAFYETLNTLPKEIIPIVQLILDHFDELHDMPPKLARGAIIRELRNQGWKWEIIWDSMKKAGVVLAITDFGV